MKIYSTYGDEDNGNPDKLFFRDDNLDIFLDSFAYGGGTIAVKSSDGYSVQKDRILKSYIKHGTVYHDILKTCTLSQIDVPLNFNYFNWRINYLLYLIKRV
jgi:hypothetical protein